MDTATSGCRPFVAIKKGSRSSHDDQWDQDTDNQAQSDFFSQNPSADIRSAAEGQQHENHGKGQPVIEPGLDVE
ncbi:hypothetical protein ACQCSV_03420 [Pseudarthrobacter sp. S3]|uniref:hypothetical protein n=1 Tax=Pseudarthrobacter sp. S3 TaxID=3418419 RepID=UPI00339259C3